MVIIGLVLIGAGLIMLYVGIYQRNAVQGVVSEASIVFLVMFGLLDWKNNKFAISIMILGVIIVLASVFI